MAVERYSKADIKIYKKEIKAYRKHLKPFCKLMTDSDMLDYMRSINVIPQQKTTLVKKTTP